MSTECKAKAFTELLYCQLHEEMTNDTDKNSSDTKLLYFLPYAILISNFYAHIEEQLSDSDLEESRTQPST